MKYGSRTLTLVDPPLQGDDVRALQQKIVFFGSKDKPVSCSGVFDADTKAAVEKFQETFDLEVTGVADGTLYQAIYDWGQEMLPHLEAFLEDYKCDCIASATGDDKTGSEELWEDYVDGEIDLYDGEKAGSAATCTGFGNGLQSKVVLTNQGTYTFKSYTTWYEENPGIDRTLVWLVLGVMKLYGVTELQINDGYRCNYSYFRINRYYNASLSNHTGHAIDFLVPNGLGATRPGGATLSEWNTSESSTRSTHCNEIRDDLEAFGFVEEGWKTASNAPRLEPRTLATTWTHMDVTSYSRHEYVTSMADALEPHPARPSWPIDFGAGHEVDVENAGLAFSHTETEHDNGYFPLGANTLWHGGVHVHGAVDMSVVLPVSGTVVLARLAPPGGPPEATPLGSRNFVLVRHGAEERIWYSLFMHLAERELDADDDALKAIPWLARLEPTLEAGETLDGIVYDSTGDYIVGVEDAWNVVIPLEDGTASNFKVDEFKEGDSVRVALRLIYELQAVRTALASSINVGAVDADGLGCELSSSNSELEAKAKERAAFAVELRGSSVHVTLAEDGPDAELLEELASGAIVAPDRPAPSGEPLWFMGELGREGEREPVLHWEVFSEENLYADDENWTAIDDEDPAHGDDLTMDSAQIYAIVGQEFNLGDPFMKNLDEDEIRSFYQGGDGEVMRTFACRFRSEWGLDVDATLERMAEWFFVDGVREEIEPYQWWNELDAEQAALLPAGKTVWHYNPIQVLLSEALDVSASDVTAPGEGEDDTEQGSYRGTLEGLYFDTNKTFLLPSALGSVRALKRFFDENPSEVLIVGHADRTGEDEYNRALSEQRAASMASYLLNDAEAWLAWFSEGSSKQWGTREDQHMLSALSDASGPFFSGEVTGVADAATSAAVERFQNWANATRGASLVPDGASGPNTRGELVPAYMDLDETTLPAGTVILTHGCGEFHPDVATADGVAEAQNRRVEVFFFGDGVAPLPQPVCPGPGGCSEHNEWLLGVIDEIDLDDPGEDESATVVTFTCEKIDKKDLVHVAQPMAWCRVYAFREEAGELVRLEGNEPAPETELDGSCPGLDLTPGETYQLYFAGKELSETQLEALTTRRRNALVEVTVPEDLEVHIPQSFSWWIALLHHVEAEIADPDEVLTRVRKLYYDDANWNWLIWRGSIDPLYERDGEGRITELTSVAFEIVTALGKTYEMAAPDQFLLDDDGDRTIKVRHDFVTLPHGGEIQISHTLTGMESFRFGPKDPTGIEFPYPRSATTWAGDLGQAVDEAVTALLNLTDADASRDYDTLLETDIYLVQETWDTWRDDKASMVQLHGDVHGIVIGGAIEDSFVSLSEILEEYLCNPARDVLAKAWWIEAYAHHGVTSDLVRSRSIADLPIRDEVNQFAETFDRWGERRNFNSSRAVDHELVTWSLGAMCDALNALDP